MVIAILKNDIRWTSMG